jgi:hypothetical protein
VEALTAADTTSPNLFFSITSGDSLTSVRFANYKDPSTLGKATTVGTPTGTTGVLASFNAATGKVASVMPYAANRSASGAGAAPKAVREGGALIVRGRFLSAFDAVKGDDRAPHGASRIALDPRTGEILAAE